MTSRQKYAAELLKYILFLEVPMNEYENMLKATLFSIIDDMGNHTRDFVINPDKDFIRNRKLGFGDFMKFTLSLGSKSTNNELLSYFNYDLNTPTVSAYNQQKAKITPAAFKYLFDKFTDILPKEKNYNGYRLIACDGSDINISGEKNDDKTFIQSGNKKGYHLMHLSAFYDLLNELYLDAEITPKREMDEKEDCVKMITRSCYEKVILIADRGYETYNIFAHAKEKGWKFLIRVKDIDTENGIVHGCHLGLDGEFDVQQKLIITRSCTNYAIEHKDVYKRLTAYCRRFDYIKTGDTKSEYPMSVRIVRIKIGENKYETLITNLEEKEFPTAQIKTLYHMRWGIETAFREVKYYVGMLNLHSKKQDYISQEIYANLVVHNFCKAVTNHICIKKKPRNKHMYKLNTVAAVSVCRYFLFERYEVLSDLEMLLKRYLTPIRPDRSFQRKVADKKPVSFNYRQA